MTECEKVGMSGECGESCPVFLRGECKHLSEHDPCVRCRREGVPVCTVECRQVCKFFWSELKERIFELCDRIEYHGLELAPSVAKVKDFLRDDKPYPTILDPRFGTRCKAERKGESDE